MPIASQLLQQHPHPTHTHTIAHTYAQDMYGHWAKPEEGRAYYVAVGPRELAPVGPLAEPPAAAGEAGAAAEVEVVLGGVAIKAGAALRPLPPADGPEQATGSAADASESADTQNQLQLRHRKPPQPAVAAATANGSNSSNGAAASSGTTKAPSATAKAATGAAATTDLPTGFTAAESSFHDSPGPHDVLLYRMVVDPTVRRRGVGRRLVEHVMERTAAVGGARVLLASANPEAVRFYEACGFSRDGLKQPGSSSQGKGKEKDDGKGKGKAASGPALLGRRAAVGVATAAGVEAAKAVGEQVVQAAGNAA